MKHRGAKFVLNLVFEYLGIPTLHPCAACSCSRKQFFCGIIDATRTRPHHMASPTPSKDERDAALEPLHPPQTPGWIKEQIEKQGGGPYRPSTTTITDALTFLNKRAERQLIMKSRDGYTSDVGSAISTALEDGTPQKNVVSALKQKVAEINPTRRSLTFEDPEEAKPLKRPDYSNHPNMIRAAITFLNLRNQRHKDGKDSIKEAAFKAKLDEAHKAAVEKGVPDKLIEDALEEKLEQVIASPESPA